MEYLSDWEAIFISYLLLNQPGVVSARQSRNTCKNKYVNKDKYPKRYQKIDIF